MFTFENGLKMVQNSNSSIFFKKMFKINILFGFLYVVIITFMMYKTFIFMKTRPQFEQVVWSNVIFVDFVMIFHFLHRCLNFHRFSRLDICNLSTNELEEILLLEKIDIEFMQNQFFCITNKKYLILIYNNSNINFYDYLYFNPNRINFKIN